jgi:Fe(3+) dicitrate transport protein
MMRWIIVLSIVCNSLVSSIESAGNSVYQLQRRDTIEFIKVPVVVFDTAIGVRRLPPTVDEVRLFSSKKAEILDVAPGDANVATNNTRQVFARAADVMIWENDGTGVQAGVAIRGLSPNRSWEFNTRMNSVDIAADFAAYPEAYFTPAFESLERIEIIRGAAALQYGPQFGGLLNYVTKSAPRDRFLGGESLHIGGQNGYYSTYTSVGGTYGAWSYYFFGNYRRSDGWRSQVVTQTGERRESDRFWQNSSIPKLEYRPSDRTIIVAEVAAMRYLMQQPGGLDSAQFATDGRQAVCYRDWFEVPWVVPSLSIDHQIDEGVHFNGRLFAVLGERNSIGLTTLPSIVDTGTNPRRVNTDSYRNGGVELRLRWDLPMNMMVNPLVMGVRLYRGSTIRKQGRGADGDEFSTTFVAPLTRDLEFVSENIAAFAEWHLRLSERLAITPGARLEWLGMIGRGRYAKEKPATSPTAFDTAGQYIRFDKRSHEVLPLWGFGMQWSMTTDLELYANAHQSWRPAQFSKLFPNNPSVAVDPMLHSSRGVSTDIGIRGTIEQAFSLDISGFYLYYGDRIGTIARAALGTDIVLLTGGASQLRRNVGVSEHRGIEFYAELFSERILPLHEHSVSIFVAGAFTDARYTNGPFAGKFVEYAPHWIVRNGLRYLWKAFMTFTLLENSVSQCYADASNVEHSASGVTGIIPAYTIWDVSSQIRITTWLAVEININNIFDRRYFTRRAGGYPGPGIIPADGRVVTDGLRFLF